MIGVVIYCFIALATYSYFMATSEPDPYDSEQTPEVNLPADDAGRREDRRERREGDAGVPRQASAHRH